ncbi:MAG: helix-turn-helix domain-containing protein, partial [Acidobacteriota bacterium]
DWHRQGSRVAAACTGSYVLASSGLLDGQRATTTWWLGPDFRQRFGQVVLDDTEMVVDSDGRVTAGAALAHVDLALWFVRELSPTLARTTSKHLLVDGRPSQATYAMSDHLAHSDPVVERFERWARGHLKEFSMSAAARAVGASERTLERRMRKVLGQTPIAFVRRLRVERALLLLETTDHSVEAIAGEVGYGDGVTLRTLLRKQTGFGIRQLRRRR